MRKVDDKVMGKVKRVGMGGGERMSKMKIIKFKRVTKVR